MVGTKYRGQQKPTLVKGKLRGRVRAPGNRFGEGRWKVGKGGREVPPIPSLEVGVGGGTACL